MFYAGLVAVLLVVAVLTTLIAASRRKKAHSIDGPLFSATGVVTTQLSPTGSIMVEGELFFAESALGDSIPQSTNVKVVGARNHLLRVIPQ